MKGSQKRWHQSLQALLTPTFGFWLGCFMAWGGVLPGAAQGAVQLNDYCQISQADASRKEALRRAAFENNDAQAKSQYEALVAEHAQALNQCRAANWPREQALLP